MFVCQSKVVLGVLHPIGQSPNFLPDEEIKNRQGSGLDRPTRLHQISGRNAKPKFRLSSFKRLFQRPSRLSHRIGLRSGHPALSRPAAPPTGAWSNHRQKRSQQIASFRRIGASLSWTRWPRQDDHDVKGVFRGSEWAFISRLQMGQSPVPTRLVPVLLVSCLSLRISVSRRRFIFSFLCSFVAISISFSLVSFGLSSWKASPRAHRITLNSRFPRHLCLSTSNLPLSFSSSPIKPPFHLYRRS